MSGVQAVLGAGLVVLVVVAWLPARRVPTGRGDSTHRRGGGERQRRGPWRHGRRGRRADPDIGLLLTEVSSRLRAGGGTDAAWLAALRRAGLLPGAAAGLPTGRPDGAGAGPPARATPARWPSVLSSVQGRPAGGRLPAAARVPAGWGGAGVPQPLAELLRQPVRDPAVRASLAAVVAACRLTHEVGAPLAQVLDRCAQSITEASEAHDARRVAMAGPVSTARILAVLPIFGLLLGVGLGAEPLAVAVGGGWGSVSVLLGALLVLLGRWWSASLVARASGTVEGRAVRGRSARRRAAADAETR